MKKEYVSPSVDVMELYMQDAVLGNVISGNSSPNFGDAEEGGEDEDADVKGNSYNIWDDDWSN